MYLCRAGSRTTHRKGKALKSHVLFWRGGVERERAELQELGLLSLFFVLQDIDRETESSQLN
eukprot:scaffold4505_cov84-Skeletonema_dohrnii-CCMP3373.AAC.1